MYKKRQATNKTVRHFHFDQYRVWIWEKKEQGSRQYYINI